MINTAGDWEFIIGGKLLIAKIDRGEPSETENGVPTFVYYIYERHVY